MGIRECRQYGISWGIHLLQSAMILLSTFVIWHGKVFASEYSIQLKYSNETIECGKFSVQRDERSGKKIKCSKQASTLVSIFPIGDVTIFYKNIQIFPYDWNIEKIKNSTKSENCEEIIKNLYGAFFVDNDHKSYIAMGWLHENGICMDKNISKAIILYEKILKDSPELTELSQKIAILKVALSTAHIQIVDNNNIMTECSKIEVNKEKVTCINDSGRLLYLSKTQIKSVYETNNLIYPYDSEWEKTIVPAVNERSCKTIHSILKGPLVMDNSPSAYLVMAKLYEYGICVANDKELAVDSYKKALSVDYQLAISKISSLTREIEEEKRTIMEREKLKKQEIAAENQRKEEEARAYSQRFSLIDAICQQDCSTNKYQYSTSCYNACMRTNGLY